ncbi:MAG: hypothetical protein HZB77_13195, partial [Chloroflexi bacterium]|nr:hypothetical protein [Chloroflexota bacterium]
MNKESNSSGGITMNDTTKPASWWRSILAVLAGVLTNLITTVAVDSTLSAIGIFPPPGGSMSANLYVLALAYRFPVAVIAGYVTATLSPRKPMIHALVLAGVLAVGTYTSAVAMHPDRPGWYVPGLIAIAVLCSILGEQLR